VDILVAVLGVFLGTLTGIIPGIHVNTAIALLSASRPVDKNLIIVVISASIAHTFSDVIPATFLGIPDESFAVSVYPAHEMSLDGRGIEAITISTFSGVIAAIASIPLFYAILRFIKVSYLEEFILPILILTSLFVIIERGNSFAGRYSPFFSSMKALMVFTLSGIIGIAVFKLSSNKDLFLPLFSGLFAFPILYRGVKGIRNLPEQSILVKLKPLSALMGTVSGMIVSLFPGISSGVASLLAVSPLKESDAENYVSATGAANTANALLCFAVMISAGRARSGATLALKQVYKILNPADILILCLFSVVLSAIITILAGILAERILRLINLRALCLISLIFVISAVILLTGVTGLLLFTVSCLVGLLPEKLDVKRLNCMGCLLLPLMFVRLGLMGLIQ